MANSMIFRALFVASLRTFIFSHTLTTARSKIPKDRYPMASIKNRGMKVRTVRISASNRMLMQYPDTSTIASAIAVALSVDLRELIRLGLSSSVLVRELLSRGSVRFLSKTPWGLCEQVLIVLRFGCIISVFDTFCKAGGSAKPSGYAHKEDGTLQKQGSVPCNYCW